MREDRFLIGWKPTYRRKSWKEKKSGLGNKVTYEKELSEGRNPEKRNQCSLAWLV